MVDEGVALDVIEEVAVTDGVDTALALAVAEGVNDGEAPLDRLAVGLRVETAVDDEVQLLDSVKVGELVALGEKNPDGSADTEAAEEAVMVDVADVENGGVAEMEGRAPCVREAVAA